MKFCEKCGNEILEGGVFCSNCGANSNVPQNPVYTNTSVTSLTVEKPKVTIVSILCFVVAGLVLLLSLISCFKMMGGAGELSRMSSLSGDSLAEAYYNGCGTVYGGLALFVMAFGLFASGMLTCLGLKNLKK